MSTQETLDRLKAVCEAARLDIILPGDRFDEISQARIDCAAALPALICIAEAAAKVHDYDWGDMEMNDETGEYTEVIEGILGALGSLASLKE